MMSRKAEFDHARIFAPTQIAFPDISYTSFVYPGDQEAIASLKKIPGASALLVYLQEHFTEQIILVENCEQMLKAGPANYASVYKLVVRCAEILSCPVPDIYITNNPVLNAYTMGHRQTCIVLHSGLVESLSADELTFVIGHEIGHIKCGHALYRQLGEFLVRYWDTASQQIPIPGIGLLRIPLLLAYWEWYRRAEFSCDRAGLLCLQDTQPSQKALAKLAGGVRGFEDEIGIEPVMGQVHAHKDVNKLVLIVSIIDNLQNTHPFVPVRLAELKKFAESEHFRALLDGNYERDFLGLHEGGTRWKCAQGHAVNGKLKFCPECGGGMPVAIPFEAACQGCGRSIGSAVKHCPHCGKNQTNAAPQPVKSGWFGLKR